MIKMIHCADLHLDSPMETHMTGKQASDRNTELIRSFVRLTEYAKENEVRAVIIAGDLFDSERVKARTVDAVLNAIRRSPEVDYLYLAGNHEGAADAFTDQDLPVNLKRFEKNWKSYIYEDVTVSGIELTKENSESLYQSLPKKEGSVAIVTLHGQIGTACGDGLINLNLLKDRGIDYLALGHIHAYTEGRLDARGTYCYSGCLEGRGFDECGEKGFVLLTVEDGRIGHEFVPFSCRKLHRMPIDISGLTKNAEILQRMQEAAAGIGREDMVEFLLTGSVDPTADIALGYLQKMEEQQGFFFTKVKDETHMAIHPEDYQNDISLKGEFIRLVLESDAKEEDKAAIIRTGIQALAGEEITL